MCNSWLNRHSSASVLTLAGIAACVWSIVALQLALS